jgi:hypothetical protein
VRVVSVADFENALVLNRFHKAQGEIIHGLIVYANRKTGWSDVNGALPNCFSCHPENALGVLAKITIEQVRIIFRPP